MKIEKMPIIVFFKEVLAFLGTKARSLEGGKEEQAIFDSYV